MNKELRKVISVEFQRRHGYIVSEAKIKPVHVANSLMRAEHQRVAKVSGMVDLFIATKRNESMESRVRALDNMIRKDRNRWGALGEDADIRNSVLFMRLLPLVRGLLGADNAFFGQSPEWSSFSTPTARLITPDASDDGAGEFVHWLWGGRKQGLRLEILNLLNSISDPEKDPRKLDDLSALLLPISDDAHRLKSSRSDERLGQDVEYTPIEQELRQCAVNLFHYEATLRPNPIASLQRIILLASLSIQRHAMTRTYEVRGRPVTYMLLDASEEKNSSIAQASTRSVSRAVNEVKGYTESILIDLLEERSPEWILDPLTSINRVLTEGGFPTIMEDSDLGRAMGALIQNFEDLGERRLEFSDEILREIEADSKRGLDGYVRLLGIRSGLFYPIQKNPHKRVLPSDRTLEVLVASTIDLSGPPVDYLHFLERLKASWSIVVGGEEGDYEILLNQGESISFQELRSNSDAFLSRLEDLGLARKLADSVAVVGFLGARND